MTDFRNIQTQEDLNNLFSKTNFVDDDHFDAEELTIDPVGEDGDQFVHIHECSYMGSMVPQDVENSGYDALFLQTVVQMFKAGKLKVVDNA